MEFLAICELASGDFSECRREQFKNYEDFKVCVEAKLTLLSCFNFISEDEEVRRTLYMVCKNNKSKHRLEDDGKPVLEDDSKNFNDRFGTYELFNDLFE